VRSLISIGFGMQEIHQFISLKFGKQLANALVNIKYNAQLVNPFHNYKHEKACALDRATSLFREMCVARSPCSR